VHKWAEHAFIVNDGVIVRSASYDTVLSDPGNSTTARIIGYNLLKTDCCEDLSDTPQINIEQLQKNGVKYIALQPHQLTVNAKENAASLQVTLKRKWQEAGVVYLELETRARQILILQTWYDQSGDLKPGNRMCVYYNANEVKLLQA
jgi:ABC-type sulfate/molybdate transport systems ATPase subunit